MPEDQITQQSIADRRPKQVPQPQCKEFAEAKVHLQPEQIVLRLLLLYHECLVPLSQDSEILPHIMVSRGILVFLFQLEGPSCDGIIWIQI